MKAEIEAEVLAEALKTAAGLTRANTHLLVHGCILIQADPDEGIVLTAGDGESYVQIPAGGNAAEAGSALVPAKTVAKAVAKMGGVVYLSLDDDGSLGIDTKTSRITLPTAPADEYPKIAWPAPDAKPHDLTDAWGDLALITYAADHSESPRKHSVTFIPAGYAEAYGGVRLAHCEIPEGIDTAIYRSTLDYATRILGEDTILLYDGPNSLTLTGGGVRLWSAIPQYERKPMPGIDFETPHMVTFDRKAMIEGLGLMEVVKEGDAVPVRIDVKDGELHMHASSPSHGFVATALAVEGDLPYPTGLTLAHARDAFTRCRADEVTLGFSELPNRPIRLTDDKVTHILNPNRSAVEKVKVDL